MKTLIIDDEKQARNGLDSMLRMFCPQVTHVWEAASVQEAIPLIHEHEPEIVFLDIDMPPNNGFELFTHIPDPDFHTIFVTAYDQYAIQAIRVNALDYLLKPIDPDLLLRAIERVEKQPTSTDNATKQPTATKLGVPVSQGIRFLEIERIVRIQSDGSYAKVFLEDGTSLLVSRSLKEFVTALDGQVFCRVHHSHLINLDFVKEYQRNFRGMLIMQDRAEIPIGRAYRDAVLERIDKDFRAL